VTRDETMDGAEEHVQVERLGNASVRTEMGGGSPF
jgi:hypothetical protein